MDAEYWKKLSIGALLLLGALLVITGLSFDAPEADDMLLMMVGVTVGMIILMVLLMVQALNKRRPGLEHASPISDEVIGAMFLAREETETSGHAAITDLHLLRGLMRTRGCAAEMALSRAGMRLEELPEAIPQAAANLADTGDGQLPLSVTAQACLMVARDEARNLGDVQVRTGHVLLALLRPDVSMVAPFLHEAGLDREGVVAFMITSGG